MFANWLIPDAYANNGLANFAAFIFSLFAGYVFLLMAKEVLFEVLKKFLDVVLEVLGNTIDTTLYLAGRLLIWPYDVIELLIIRNTRHYRRRRYILEVVRDSTKYKDIEVFLENRLLEARTLKDLREVENSLEALCDSMYFKSESHVSNFRTKPKVGETPVEQNLVNYGLSKAS